MTEPSAADDITVTKIFDSIRDRILAGDIAPGQVINSVDIAGRFGTSRTPVREALLLLSRYGLVSMAARRRPQVTPVSAKAIRELYALRVALHSLVAEAIVEQASDAALQALHQQAFELLQNFEHCSTEAHLQAVEHYLGAEAQLAGNQIVLDVLDSLKWKISWFRRLGCMSPAQLKVLSQDRLRVAEAYRDRDVRLADALNRSMLKKAALYCEENFMATANGVIRCL
ncbi:MAG: GntR family transcriptional regulator [Curvibacter lanceolatus]|uniref:GntR family transcriptional regulator n=1 Tax=Curvibacter lanceolatus TaxID=86182 RepID=UPI00036F364D|nr:GntR family transcriptional regulator [Curvibacter lanceolatus]MBV5295446.1 GntR family transcriptional regulator [Curvibacter lanceolatus]